MEQCNFPQKTEPVEIGLVYRNPGKCLTRPLIATSQDAYRSFMSSWDKDILQLVEQFKVMFLDHGSRCLALYTLSTGGITSTVVDHRLVFVAALKLGATKLIAAHNHPSGNLKPSLYDEQSTSKLRSAGAVLDIVLVDHLIISVEGYFSFADEEML